MKKVLTAFLLLTGLIALAANPNCAVCRRTVSGSYYTSSGRAYCSDRCFETTLARCSSCSNPFRNGVRLSSAPGKVFCSKCGSKPICFSCQLPADCRTLSDSRQLCSSCHGQAIFDRDTARQVFSEVRRRMTQEMGIGTDRTIKFGLTTMANPEWRTGSPSWRQQLGLYRYTFTERTILQPGQRVPTTSRVNENYTIYILSGIPKDKFIEVCAHELAHDWMQKNYRIDDQKINEGWAEYVAYETNRLYGNEHLNSRMERNTDPVYGGGFRFIRDYIRRHGREGLFQYFEHLSKRR